MNTAIKILVGALGLMAGGAVGVILGAALGGDKQEMMIFGICFAIALAAAFGFGYFLENA